MKKLFRNLNPEYPEPFIPEDEADIVHKKSDRDSVTDDLLSGKYIQVADAYPTGLSVLAALKKKVFGNYKQTGKNRMARGKTAGERNLPAGKNQKTGRKPDDDFVSYRKKRTRFRYASNHLLVPVENGRIALKKAPEIGWLEMFYPETGRFYLSFPRIQGLNSSWQWYRKGIQYPVLKKKIQPWYGTYFPTRFDHLILFDEWLHHFTGRKFRALDIGTGCGVLAFQMLEAGFNEVLATDISPNAIITVMENAERIGYEDRLQVKLSDLFESCDGNADLIVFNPPWLPSDHDGTGLDQAIYFKPDLFHRFFEEARHFLNDDGKIIIMFSNLGQAEGVHPIHPIEEEVSRGGRYRKVRLIKRKTAAASGKTRRRDHRKNEYVELWELEKAVSD